MAKAPAKLQQQDSLRSEKEKVVKTKSIEEPKITDRTEKSMTEVTKETVEKEEKHMTESREVEKIIEQKKEVRKLEEKKEVEKLVTEEEKEKDESKVTYTEEQTKEVHEVSAQPMMEICKELLNKERETVQEVYTKSTKPADKVTDVQTSEITKEIVIEKVDEPEKVKTIVKEIKTEIKEIPVLREEKVDIEIKKVTDGVHKIEEKTETLEEIIKERKDLSGMVKEIEGEMLTEEAMELPKRDRKIIETVEKVTIVSEHVKPAETVEEVIKERKEQREQTKELVSEKVEYEVRKSDEGKIKEIVEHKDEEPTKSKVEIVERKTEETIIHEVEKPTVQKVEEQIKDKLAESVKHEVQELIEPKVERVVVHKETVESKVEEPVVHKLEEMVIHKVEEPIKHEVEERIEHKVEEKVEHKVKEPVVHKVEEVIVHKIEKPVKHEVEERVEHKMEEIVERKVEEPIIHKVVETVVQKVEEEIERKVEEPMIHKVEETALHKIEEPVKHEVEERVEHKVEEMVVHKVEEPTTYSVEEPIVRKVEETIVHEVVEPRVQKVVEHIEEKIEKPTERTVEKTIVYEVKESVPVKEEHVEISKPREEMHEEATKIVEEVVTVAEDLTMQLHEISKENEEKAREGAIEKIDVETIELLGKPFVETTVITEEIIRDTRGRPLELRESVEEMEERSERSETPDSKKEEVTREKSTGRRIITEETTIIYKVQKDGTLVQEQIMKSVQIEGADGVPVTQVPEVSVETKIFEKGLSEAMYEIQSTSDIKADTVPLVDVKKEIQQFLEGEKKVHEDVAETVSIAPADEKDKAEEKTTTEILETTPSVQEETAGLIQKIEQVITKQASETKEEEKEKETVISAEKPVIEAEVKQMKKEFESRIPISTAKADKEKLQKEMKTKLSPEVKQGPSDQTGKAPTLESPDITSPTSKKKEFESRIPKRVVDTKLTDKAAKKDAQGKKETETYTVTEKKSSEEVTSKLEEHLTTKSETQTFSKTFTDPQEAFKMFEDMSSMKKDFATVTSKIDHKTSSTVEKKEVVSSEISTGADKIITHEEKERVERKKSSESTMKKESPAETLEEKKSKHEEIDKTAVQKMSMNLSDGKEVIDASASESRAESKKEQSFKMLEDKEGVMTRETGKSRLRESDAEVAIRIKKDPSEKTDDEDSTKLLEDISEKISKPVIDADKIEMIAQGESHKETRESFDVTQFVPSEKSAEEKVKEEKMFKPEESKEETLQAPSLEEQQRQKFKEIEARTIAETLIQSIETELEKKSAEHLKAQLLSKGYLEQLMAETVETDHEKLADDLTRKFESIMKKSMEEQAIKDRVETTKSRTSLHEEYLDKSSNRDSISISEDITKDEESSPRDKEESFPLSSSQARFQDRDITMSPSSISEQIDFEETMDVDTNELEDVSKPTSSPQSEKHRSDRSSGQVEPLQTDASFLKDRVVSEISGARVLEVLEPDSQSRQDSVDVPSLEMDEHKVSEPTSKDIPSLRESVAVDSLERIVRERDITISPSTVSEDTNIDYSLVHEHAPSPLVIPKEREPGVRRADSFEIESPPMVSPRSKVHGLEIKPVDWMIGDEKIEISETLQPSQVFNQELEAYESSMREQGRLPSQDGSTDFEQESGTKSSEDTSVIESVKETTSGDARVTTSVTRTTKFTVIPVSERELESELVENKLDISCQELVATLQREYDAKTPTEEYAESIRQGMSRATELEQQISEDITEEEEKQEESTGLATAKDEDVDTQLDAEEDKLTLRKKVTAVAESTEISEKPGVEDKKQVAMKDASKPEIELKLAKTIEPSTGEKQPIVEEEKSIEKAEITKEQKSIEKEEKPTKAEKPVEEQKSVKEEKVTKEATQEVTEHDVPKHARVDDVLKEWTEAYLSKIKPPGDEYKRHMEKAMEKAMEKHDRPGRSTAVPSDTCAFKIKKDDLPSVDLSARYAITVLDQVVKKEIAEVKESLEAAKQDLIEELSENSETVIQIKDSPSEFQFKLQPESIPNDLPFLYRPPSPQHMPTDRESETTKRESSVDKPRKYDPSKKDATDSSESRIDVEDSTSSSFEEPEKMTKEEIPVIETEKSDVETTVTVHDDTKDDEEGYPSPIPASRSGSDVDNKDESSSLAPPHPVPRRRHKPARASRRVTSESEADVGSSSGDSSNYQSCDYEIGSGSRPSSSDVEAMQSCGVPSGTASEYETAVMSMEHSSPTRPTSQEYHTAVSTLSSRESMKSLNSLSSGHLGSIDSTSELSETLVPSETDVDKEEIDENLEYALEEERAEQSESSGSDIPIDEAMDKIDSHVPCRMKRSSEMIFQQIIDDNATLDSEHDVEEAIEEDAKGIDSATSAFTVTLGTFQSVDIMTSRVSEDGIQSVCTQVISTQVTTTLETEVPVTESEAIKPDSETYEKDTEIVTDVQTIEPDSLEPGSSASGIVSDSPEITMQTSALSMMQQASMSTSSTSGVSIETVIEKEKSDRHSPDSDSFELVDKPDIIDDFVVIEEVGREAEEYDSEGKSIRISAIPQVSSKNYDRDLENLITETKEDSQVSTSQTSRNNELFDFESEESPPQASNDDQYSQSYSDEEQYEGGKKWIEMQFQADARVYDIEYDRGPLEDIKEEEITDFEAGSSRFGSLGSHKESIGSVGSMRGSFGSTPDYDVLAGKKYFTRPTDHDNVSLSSLQEFEHLESTVAAENSKRMQCGSQDSINNGSLPRRYMTSRSGHGDDISLSSLKDFEGLEKACREAHLIELRAREEEDLLEHESPENRYKLEAISRTRTETSGAGSFNPSTSGSDDYEKRIKEIDEIIRIAQSNVEKIDRQDDTTEDISQIEITDGEKVGSQVVTQPVLEEEEPDDAQPQKESNVMETSTDSLELEDNADKKHHPLCRSSDSLEMKTTLDFPSLSSDSLNNVRDAKEMQSDTGEQASSVRRISSDSLDMPLLEQQDVESHERDSESSSNSHSERVQSDNSLGQTPSTETNVKNGKTKTMPSSGI